MATKIRLQRFGKKGKPFYHVVVADSRSPRDGKFIERLGSYNPNTNPATIEINFEKTLDWVNKGAQPTDTCRAILSYKGVMYKKHLEGGIKKGALTQEQADEKFAQWLEGKTNKIEGKKEGLSSTKAETRKTALAAEAKKKEDRAAAIVAKNTPPANEVSEEEAPEVTAAEPAEAEAITEMPAEEAPAIEESEAAEPAVEEPAVIAEEAPAAEPVAEEAADEPIQSEEGPEAVAEDSAETVQSEEAPEAIADEAPEAEAAVETPEAEEEPKA